MALAATLHPRVAKIYAEREKMAAGKQVLDWGYAENLAYASLLVQGLQEGTGSASNPPPPVRFAAAVTPKAAVQTKAQRALRAQKDHEDPRILENMTGRGWGDKAAKGAADAGRRLNDSLSGLPSQRHFGISARHHPARRSRRPMCRL